MEFRQVYENLLRTLCKSYGKMFKLLENVEQCDKELARLAAQNRPEVDDVCGVTAKKDQLLATLDQISLAVEPLHQQLDGMIELCQEIDVHPLYFRMEEMQIMTYYYIRKVINREDINNPEIVRRLNDYKESLELDKALSEIPQSQRKVYMLVPEKKG